MTAIGIRHHFRVYMDNGINFRLTRQTGLMLEILIEDCEDADVSYVAFESGDDLAIVKKASGYDIFGYFRQRRTEIELVFQ